MLTKKKTMKTHAIINSHNDFIDSFSKSVSEIEREFSVKIQHIPMGFILTTNEQNLKINYREDQISENYLDRRLRRIIKTIQSNNTKLADEKGKIEGEQQKGREIIRKSNELNFPRPQTTTISRAERSDREDRGDKQIGETYKSTGFLNYVQIPMNELIAKLGFKIKREKTSRNSIVMKNDRETIVINRGYRDGNYLYYNVNEPEDRGTIFNFCKNRDIDIHQLVNQTNIQNIKHTIDPKNKDYSPRIAKEFNQLPIYNKSNINSLEDIRKISSKITNMFSSIKTDKWKNVVFPSYTVEEIKDYKHNTITISGITKKLLERPLTHDRNGIKYEKPINSLEKGKKGISVLKADGVKTVNITKIIVGENLIDNLSYLEMKKIDPKKVLLIAFNGGIKKESEIAFLETLKQLSNAKEIVLVYDNDEKGFQYDLSTKKLLDETEKNKLSIIIDKSEFKDWNEDIKAYKLIKKEKPLNNELTLKEGIVNEFAKKINMYHCFPDVPPEAKSKLFKSIEQLAQWINLSQKQNEQLDKIRETQRGLERGGR